MIIRIGPKVNIGVRSAAMKRIAYNKETWTHSNKGGYQSQREWQKDIETVVSELASMVEWLDSHVKVLEYERKKK